MKRMLYLCYINYFHDKVVPYQAFKTIESLSNYFNIEFLSPWISGSRLQKLEKNLNIQRNIRIIKLPLFPFLTNTFIQFFRLLYACQSYIFALFTQHEFIYTRDFSVVYFLSKLPKWLRLKTPIIFEIHKIYHKTSNLVRFKQEEKAYDCINYFVATSENCKADLHNLFDINLDRILVTPNGVDLIHFQRRKIQSDILRKYSLKKEDKIIVYGGSFLWWKGVDDLIHSMKHITCQDAKLMLIGGSGKNFDNMRKLTEKEDLSEKIIFTGYLTQPTLISLLQISQIAVLPNIRSVEGERYTSPVKLFEYLACGLPILAAELDSIKELLVEPDNCLFFTPGNRRELASCIDHLLENPNLRNSMSRQNLLLVKKYTWKEKSKTIYHFLSDK